MPPLKASLLTILVGTFGLSDAALAAAFQLYEMGTPIIGTAGVGQAAIISDASAAYFNPAGMGFLSGTEFMLGAQMLAPDIQFSIDSSTTISGGDGGNAGTILAGMDIYFAYNYSPNLKLGVSVASPYGGSLTYNDGWVGRFYVQNALFFAVDLNPSVAYRFNDWFAAAAGVTLEYMSLQQTLAIPIPQTNDIEGQLNLKVDNYAPGFNLGVMFTPGQSTKIGVAYRSQITHKLEGDVTFLRIAPVPGTSTKMIMPQNVMVSIAQDLTDCITLLAEGGWANWSTMTDTALNIRNITAVTPRHWKDTYRLGVAGQVKITPDLMLQAGVSFDSSPTDAKLRLPDLPMDQQIRAGTGVVYSIMKPVKIAFSYEYINFGKAEINNTSANGVLSGEYHRNYANTLQASINVCI
jgi:long-chain fatty acid transport protein